MPEPIAHPRAPTELAALFRAKRGKVGVIGLGYVGLPICLAAAKSGLDVIGFDIDDAKPVALAEGRSYLRHISVAAISSGRFAAASDVSRLAEPDALLVCVPTPLTAYLEPNVSYVISTVQLCGRSPPGGGPISGRRERGR